MADDNVILFPVDKIKNKANTGVKDTKFQKRIEKEQTNKFVETAVDDIALKLLHHFVDLAMKTQTETFTKDFSFLVVLSISLTLPEIVPFNPSLAMIMVPLI